MKDMKLLLYNLLYQMWEKEKDQESQVIQRNGRDGISLWK